MTLMYPWMLAVAAVVVAVLVLFYRALDRRRAAALAAAGMAAVSAGSAGTSWWSRGWRWLGRRRRHIPPLLFLAGLAVLLIGLGRPQATVQIPRASGTVVLAFDVSNSMAATDVAPTRLVAAQDAALDFINNQPDSVDIGVVAFDVGAMTAKEPTNNHDQLTTTIKSLRPAGRTSLGSAILGSLSMIVGKPVELPQDGQPAPDLGYRGSATIVLLSDGEDTGGPDPVAAAELAATAGIRIEAVGVGTVDGAIITVEGFQVQTALNEPLLTDVAQATGATYHRATDTATLKEIYKSVTLRLTTRPQLTELTGLASVIGLMLLTAGGLLMIVMYGRIV